MWVRSSKGETRSVDKVKEQSSAAESMWILSQLEMRIGGFGWMEWCSRVGMNRFDHDHGMKGIPAMIKYGMILSSIFTEPVIGVNSCKSLE